MKWIENDQALQRMDISIENNKYNSDSKRVHENKARIQLPLARYSSHVQTKFPNLKSNRLIPLEILAVEV